MIFGNLVGQISRVKAFNKKFELDFVLGRWQRYTSKARKAAKLAKTASAAAAAASLLDNCYLHFDRVGVLNSLQTECGNKEANCRAGRDKTP